MAIYQVTYLRAFKDNYIWCIINHRTQQCVIADPGDAQPVLEFLPVASLQLTAILVTHHHWDHTNGIAELLNYYSVPVYGPNNSLIKTVSHPVKENDTINLLDGLTLQALAVPGHTLDHLAYYGHNYLFCGDTLFAGGCGRLFEGSAAQLYSSLLRLAALPETTEVYCAHEYTKANLNFARTVEPDNSFILTRIAEVEAKLQEGSASLPSNIGIEKLTNPFLRSHVSAVAKQVAQHSGVALENPLAVFAATRLWKDNYSAIT